MSLLQRIKNRLSRSAAVQVPSEYRAEFRNEVAQINFDRSRILAIVLLLIHIPLLYRDIWITRAAGLFEENAAYEHLFYAHLAVFVFCSFYLVGGFLLGRKKNRSVHKGPMSLTFVVVILLWAVVLAGFIANRFHGQITEYIIAMLGVVATFYMPPRISIAVIVAGQASFVTILALTTANPNSGGHITNTMALAIIAWALSTVIFNGFKRSFINRKIIEEQKANLETSHRQLERSNGELHKLNQEKNVLMGIVAHDLKNPLGSILLSLGNVQHYGDRMPKADLMKHYDAIERSTSQMLSLINDLLDENAIESGTYSINPQDFSVSAFLPQVVMHFEAKSRRKNIAMHLHLPEPDIRLHTDPRRLEQVLVNLVSNALKFSESGKRVDVSAELKKGFVEFRIADQGPGISAEDQQKLFIRFARLTARPTGGENSTGLGLSIVKKIVEALDGDISCSSTVGVGTCFTVRLKHIPAGNS